MEIVLALGSALTYGISDFIGGFVTKRAQVFSVILASQVISAAILAVVVPFWDGDVSAAALYWGSAAGLAALAGAALLYRGLAIGRMGVVAPVTAVLAAAIPVAFGLATGERPSAVALAGILVGLVAVVLISSSPEPASTAGAPASPPPALIRPRLAGVTEAVGAGVAFGVFFVLLGRAPDGSGVWPLVGTRISMLAVAALIVAFAGTSPRAAGLDRSVIALGIINLSADLLFLLATRRGLLSIVAVITALYPAATVGLARIVLDERMVRQQLLGVGFAALSVTLIALR
jgi:drug/metabolite transporter (DMT)-like permease